MFPWRNLDQPSPDVGPIEQSALGPPSNSTGNSLFSLSPISLFLLKLLTGYSTDFTYLIGGKACAFIGVLF